MDLLGKFKEKELAVKGEALFRMNKYKEALKYYKKILSINNSDENALKRIGECYYNLKNYPEAVKYFNKFLKIKPINDRVSVLKIKSLYYNGDLLDAENCCSNFLENKQPYDILLMMGYIKFKLNQPKEAMNSFDKAFKNPKKIIIIDDYLTSEEYVAILNIYLSLLIPENRYDSIIECYNKILEIKKNDVNSLVERAHYLFKINNYDEAIKSFQKAYELDKNSINKYLDEYISSLEKQAISLEDPSENYKKILKYNKNNFNALFGLANYYYKIKNYKKANYYYAKILDYYPNDISALKGKGKSSFKLDNFSDAIESMDVVLSKNDDKDALLIKALSLNNLERYEESIELFKYYLTNFDSGDMDAIIGIANALTRLGKNKEADVYYDKILSKNPKNVLFCLNKAINLHNQKEYAHSNQLLDRILADSVNIKAYILKAKNLNLMGEYQKSIDLCNKILEIDENNEEILSLIGINYFNLEDYKKAIDSFKLFLIEYPDKLDTIKSYYIESLENLSKNCDYTTAIKYYDILLELDSDNIEYKLLKAWTYNKLDDYNSALNIYDEIFEKSNVTDKKYIDDYIDVLINKANEYESEEELEKAITCYDKILKYDSENKLALSQKSFCLTKIGKNADDIIDKILSKDENDIETLINFAQNYNETGSIQKSFELYEKVLSLDSENIKALTFICKYHYENNDYQDAINISDKLLKINPENNEYLIYKAKSLMGLDKYSEALFSLNQILKDDAGNIDALTEKANCLYKLHKYYDSIDVFEEILEKDNANYQAFIGLANNFYCTEDYKDATVYFEKLDNETLKKYIDKYSFSCLKYAQDLMESDKYGDAIIYFDKTLADDSKNYEALIGKAHCLYNLEDIENSYNAFNEASEINTTKDLKYCDEYIDVLFKKVSSSNNNDLTISYYDKILYYDSNNQDALLAKGLLLVDNNRFGDARDSITKVLDNDNTNEEAILAMGKIHLDNQEFEDAIKCFDKLSSIDALIGKAKALNNLEKYIESISVYDEILSKFEDESIIKLRENTVNNLLSTDFVKSELENGSKLKESKQYQEAIDVYDNILKYDNLNYESIVSKADCYKQLNKPDLAYNCYLKSLDMDDKNIDVLISIAEVCDINGEYELSLDYYQKALTLKNKNLNVLLGKIKVLTELNRFEDVIDSYDYILINKLMSIDEFKQDYINKSIIVANKLFKDNKWENALIYYNKVLNIDKDNEEALLYAANSYKNISDLKQAISHFEHLLEINSSKFGQCHDEYYEALTTYINEIDNHEVSINYIDTFIKYDKNNVSVYLLKVNELILLQKCDDAYTVCDKILSIDENNLEAHFYKSKILFYEEKYVETIKLCNDYLKLDNNDKIEYYKSVSYSRLEDSNFITEIFDEAKEYEENEDYANAIKKYDEILEMNSQNNDALIRKACCLYYFEKYEDASILFKEILSNPQNRKRRFKSFKKECINSLEKYIQSNDVPEFVDLLLEIDSENEIANKIRGK